MIVHVSRDMFVCLLMLLVANLLLKTFELHRTVDFVYDFLDMFL